MPYLRRPRGLTGEVDLRCAQTIKGEGAVHMRYEVP
jgi:hypothetical protein